MSRPASESRPRSRRAVLNTTVAIACAGAIAVGSFAEAAGPPPVAPIASAAQIEILVGENAEISRVEFHGASGARAAVRRNGRDVVVRLPGAGRPDIGRLRADPPLGVEKVETRAVAGGVELVFTLVEGAEAKTGHADGAVYLHVFRPPPEAARAAERPNPVPKSGAVNVLAEAGKDRLSLSFPWAAPVGAAVFRRGEAVWIVFDAKAKLDLSKAPRALGPVDRIRWTSGPGWTVARVEAPEDVPVDVQAQGATWTVVFGGPLQPPQGEVKIKRDDESGPPALTATLSGAGRVVWLKDPAVGDRFAAVTALAPVKTAGRRREYVEATLIPTAHGLAIEAAAGDLQVSTDGDLVRITRPGGLKLSSPVAARAAAVPAELPKPALLPAVIKAEEWAQTGEGGFLARHRQLQDLAALEAQQADAGVNARMALARFLVGTELSYEAIGVLDGLARQNQAVLADPEFRGLRGAARAMVGRWREAQADFSAPVLASDASAELWRGYTDARLGHYADARKGFQQGARAIDLFPAKWKARFAIEHARAAIETGDLRAARSLLAYGLEQPAPALDKLAGRLVQARLFELEGDSARALKIYDLVAQASYDAIATPAKLRATKIRLDQGLTPAPTAIKALDSLRFRWRGDATEVEVIRTLGEIYLQQGRYREALDALRSAGGRLPDSPGAVQLQADLSNAFRGLFLDGLADGLEPIQALALFYDFRELTPVGADGDEMVRRLARRLVDVDLLKPAAELLQYQVDNRLDGVAKAQVAADLATVHLMDRDPEGALKTIWGTRTTVLPNALLAERRGIEARALMELGRYDHALEVLGRDASPEATDVRTEIAWREKDWAAAAPMLERRLGDRWKQTAEPLSGDDESRLIRAGVAYSLAGDGKALARLSERFGGFIDRARAPDALRVALSGLDGASLKPSDFAKAAAQADSFAGWVASVKKKLRDKTPPRTTGLGLPVRGAAPAAPPAPTQAAALKPSGKPSPQGAKGENLFF
ncbi:hypothetical protein [Caulobacter sp. 17J65-9]|uniref:tetratricopeptide repeat protein n=1 Tax=Caulobacter sp. 17J65-9 TaxID=2709382 RepID=UPI00196A12E4|nr:hypothetical protein [Caulobacter sp. 17J65-9]